MIEGLPDKLKEARKNINLSQKEVANYLKISPSIVAGYETGYRTPSTEVLIKLSGLYQCSLDYLVGKKKENQIVIDIDGLNEIQISAIRTMVKAMKQKHE
ncbi:MAG: helix-turn-helix domain-containing protein [Lachnospiraceae bacterium]|nr:helix-turn-helix domain-containing protein [Lachnospiraceae bacterium]